MRTSPPVPRRRSRNSAIITLVVGVLVVLAAPGAARAAADDPPAPPVVDGGTTSLDRGWLWPVQPFRLERPFIAPPHEYGPGHRGIDLLPSGADVVVRAPAPGVIAFVGQVAGRGVVTVDHGGGLVSTLEPVETALAAGTPVSAATPLGTVSAGGHTEAGAIHFGVRLDGVYINPLVLLGGVPRAVLLPCC